MDAQAQALDSQRQGLTEDGWREIVVGRREDVQDRLYSMDAPEREFDKQTQKKLAKVSERHEKLEACYGMRIMRSTQRPAMIDQEYWGREKQDDGTRIRRA